MTRATSFRSFVFQSLFAAVFIPVILLVFARGTSFGQVSVEQDPDHNARLKAQLDFPILFVKRHNYQGLHIYDTFYQWRRNVQNPGVSGIYVLENPSAPASQQRIRTIIDPTTPVTLGDGNYFDASLSWDATKLLFCYKGTPTGNSIIYEIGVDGTNLRQLTNLDSQGNPYHGSGTGHHDVRPAYLPDGRIVFTSTRYSGLVPCANNGVAILHVMNSDGSDVHTISVNNVTEFDPSVLPDGRILFGRWEYIDKNALTIQSLWSVYPDGTNETAFFANNMVFPEAILQARSVPGNDNLVVGTFAPHNAPPRGAIAMINIQAGKQNAATGKNDVRSIFNFEHPDCPTWDRGHSCDPWAISENVVLYSGIMPAVPPKSQPMPGNVNSRPGNPAQPQGRYNAILVMDRSGEMPVEIIADPSIDLHNPIPLLPRPVPPVLVDQTDRTKTTGSFFVTDVYEGLDALTEQNVSEKNISEQNISEQNTATQPVDVQNSNIQQGVERGRVKWLRVVEETSRVSASPGSNGLNQTFSISAAAAWSPKIYHGIVPVNEDGSVCFEAPSGRAIYFQLLDKDYRLVRSMRTFIQAAPGTVRSCTGCHYYGPPKGKAGQLKMASMQKPKKLMPENWGPDSPGTGYMDYPSMIQPIFDRNCVRCHGGEEGIAAGLDLSNGPTELFNISYVNLTSRRQNQYQLDLISGICCMNGTAFWSCKIFPPLAHGTGNAPLAQRLISNPTHNTRLSAAERNLLFTWIDSNAIYFGTWNYTSSGPLLRPWTDARSKIVELLKDSRCAECHADANGNITRFENDWINLAQPEMSRILRAPMKKDTSAQNPTSQSGFGIAACRNRQFDQNYRRLGIMSSGRYEHSVHELSAFPTQEWQPVAASGVETSQQLADDPPVISMESTTDPLYVQMLAIIRQAKKSADANPRVDMPGAFERGTGVIAGRSRQILPQPIPDVLPKVTLRKLPSGRAELSWEHSARNIGLTAQIHRSVEPNFTPGPDTEIAQTELFRFVDKTVTSSTQTGPVKYYYAVVFASDPAQTCGTCRVVSEGFDSEGNILETAPQQQSIEGRCPLSMFAPVLCSPVRPEPEFVEIVPKPKAPLRTVFEAPVPDLAQPLGFARYPHEDSYNAGDEFEVELEVFFEQTDTVQSGSMPVVMGFGVWNQCGWFLQKFNGRWRFHIAGTDCDSTSSVPVNEWVHVKLVYRDGVMTILENGRQVGQKSKTVPGTVPGTVPMPGAAWNGPLYIGQYSGSQDPPYQLRGKVRNVKIRSSWSEEF